MKSMVKAALAAICVVRQASPGRRTMAPRRVEQAVRLGDQRDVDGQHAQRRAQAGGRPNHPRTGQEEYLRMQKSGIFSVSTSCTKAASSGRGPARRGRACIGWGAGATVQGRRIDRQRVKARPAFFHAERDRQNRTDRLRP